MIKIKKNNKAHNEYKVTMTMTAGKILSLKHALEAYAKAGSPLSQEMSEFLNSVISEDDNLKSLLHE